MDKENKIECINLSQYIKVDEVLPVFNGEEAGIIIRREDDTFIYLIVGSNMYKEIPKILIVKGESSGIFPRKGENKLSWSEIPTLYFAPAETCIYYDKMDKSYKLANYCGEYKHNTCFICILGTIKSLRVDNVDICKFDLDSFNSFKEYIKLRG